MQYLRQNLRFRLRTSPSTPTTDNQYFGGYKRVAKTEAKILAQNHFPSGLSGAKLKVQLDGDCLEPEP
jgi:hypothetical protein